MKKNLGVWDRIVRALLGVASLCASIVFYRTSYTVLAILFVLFAILMFIETAIGHCWLYSWLGVDTAKKTKKRK